MSNEIAPAIPGIVIKFSQANKFKPSEGTVTPDEVGNDNAPQNGTSKKIELSEVGIAEEFVTQYSTDLRYDHKRKRWFRFTGNHWKQDETRSVFDLARWHCRKLRGGKKRLATKNAIEGIEKLAQRDQRIAVTSDIWDRDPLLLGTPGGTVNLKTGELQKVRRDDFITKLAAVAPAPKGTPCPMFEAFLMQATNGDTGLCRFLQQWCGYCLTGVTKEQALMFIYGTGGNGKGVFKNVLTEIMGDYSKTANMQTFVASKQQRHLTELAMLHGARLVTACETDRGQEWSQSRVNSLTGNDAVTANYMHCDHFTYMPQLKLVIIGNDKPNLASVNDAVKRRFNIVPFVHTPPKPDKELGEKLKAEYPAILRWMIDGCLDWQKYGLVRPKAVVDATDEYFKEQDSIGKWIDEKCDLGPEKKAAAAELYASWREYAIAIGEQPGSHVTFASALVQHGFESKKSGVTIYKGIAPKKNFILGNLNDQM